MLFVRNFGKLNAVSAGKEEAVDNVTLLIMQDHVKYCVRLLR